MKRKFLLIPMLAGLMLAASCSKDDGTSVADDVITPSSEVEQPVAKKTYPLTIQAKKETSVSKIGLGGTDGLSQVFEEGEVLTLVCTDGDANLEPIKLGISGGIGTTSATFSIDDMGEDAVGKTFLAVIEGKEYDDKKTVQYSTTDLADAVRKYCYLEATSDFTYNDGGAIPTLTLADQRAYIAFTVADGQTKVSLKKDGDTEYSWYPVKENGTNVWFAVSEGTYSTRLINKPLTAKKSNVYNAKCSNVVDLGPGWNILWKTTNEKTTNEKITATSYNQSNYATSAYKDEKYYTWSNACAFGRMNGNNYVIGFADPFRLPTQNELTALANIKKNPQSGESYSFADGGATFKTSYGSVFFPAAGLNGGGSAVSLGYYWSGTENDEKDGHAWYLYFYGGDAIVTWYFVDTEYSVRLVRGL